MPFKVYPEKQYVERTKVKSLTSGRTQWRVALVLLGILSYFSASLQLNTERLLAESEDASAQHVFLFDTHFYCIFTVFQAATAFSLIALGDFEVFPYTSHFWDIVYALGVYALCLETECIVHFVLVSSLEVSVEVHGEDWAEYEVHLLLLVVVRWLIHVVTQWRVHRALAQLAKTRCLPGDYFPSLAITLGQYGLLHLIAYYAMVILRWSHLEASLLLLGAMQACLIARMALTRRYKLRYAKVSCQ